MGMVAGAMALKSADVIAVPKSSPASAKIQRRAQQQTPPKAFRFGHFAEYAVSAL
jgi:hypothetical protein